MDPETYELIGRVFFGVVGMIMLTMILVTALCSMDDRI